MVAPLDEQPRPVRKPRFLLGNRFATPGAVEAMREAGVNPMELFARHEAGDWGDLCAEDKQANEDAIRDESRILSAYVLPTNVKLWVITESDRAATTIIKADEY